MRTRIQADHVLGFKDGGHALIPQGQVVYENDQIIYVGTDFQGPVDESIDLGSSLVMPGLIDLDALTDIDHLIIDSWHSKETAPGLTWSEDYFNNRRHHVFTAEERQTVREYALAQLALHGITTYMPIASEVHSDWAESFEDFVGMAETSRRIGLRGYLGPAYRSGVSIVKDDGERSVAFDEELGRQGLSDALRFLDHVDELNDPLVSGVLLPCRIETLTPALMEATAKAAAERNSLVRLHSLQGLVERHMILKNHGMTPLDLLDKTGLLNDRLLIPHGIFIDQDPAVDGQDNGDLERLAASGASIIHCPQTIFRYGMVLRSFGKYLKAGVNMCLGTDSFPPDLIRGMDTGVHVAKIVDGAADAAPAERYVEAATLGGARALRREDLGKLEVGAQADIVAFSLSDFRDGVHADPIRTLLLNSTARALTYSVVAGRTVVKDGQLPGIDVAALHEKAQALFDRMREAYSERDFLRRKPDVLFPSTFPVYNQHTH